MAKKPTMITIGVIPSSSSALNTNFQELADAFDNTISRDGSAPNNMEADLDMNSNDILNVGEVDVINLRVGSLAIDGILVSPESVAVSPSASVVGITDAGDFYAGLNVEQALQEVGPFTEVTASTAEINILDGVVVSTGELNSLSGVTSNLQTQVDGKQPQDATLDTLSGQTITSAGLALLDDASASVQRSTLGLGITGAVLSFAMTTAPTGWLECNGSAVSRTTYAELFSAIGTTYGSGDGSTTFNLPDMRGEFPRGWDNGRGVDSGRSIGTAQSDEIASHTHSTEGFAAAGAPGAENFSVGAAAQNREPRNTESTGGNETRPRNIALMFCIKT